MAQASPKAYHRTTIYLTDEQRLWLRRTAGRAQMAGLSVSASDVIRLALDRLRTQTSADELKRELVEHVLTEAETYPGRAKRGLPGKA
jgi:hypothetical protein